MSTPECPTPLWPLSVLSVYIECRNTALSTNENLNYAVQLPVAAGTVVFVNAHQCQGHQLLVREILNLDIYGPYSWYLAIPIQGSLLWYLVF